MRWSRRGGALARTSTSTGEYDDAKWEWCFHLPFFFFLACCRLGDLNGLAWSLTLPWDWTDLLFPFLLTFVSAFACLLGDIIDLYFFCCPHRVFVYDFDLVYVMHMVGAIYVRARARDYMLEMRYSSFLWALWPPCSLSPSHFPSCLSESKEEARPHLRA